MGKQAQKIQKQQKLHMLKKLHSLLTQGHAFLEQEDYGQAILMFTKAVECNPNVAATYALRGSAYHSQKQYHEAQTDYQKSLELEFDDDIADLLELVESELREIGEDDANVWEVTKAIAIAPDNAQLYVDRAKLYYDRFCYLRAMNDSAKAIELVPDNAEAYYIHASSLNSMSYAEDDPDYELYSDDYLSKDYFDLSVKEISMAIELAPNHIDAYIARADFYLDRIGYEYRNEDEDCEQYYINALADHNAAIEIDPKRAQTYISRADCYSEHNEYDLAIADLNKAIELAIYDEKPYQMRGRIFYMKEDYDNAIADFTEAMTQGEHWASLSRANAYEKQGKYELALADITQFISKHEAREHRFLLSSIYQDRGEIYLKLKKYNLAIADFAKAVKLNPSNTEAKDLLEEIKNGNN